MDTVLLFFTKSAGGYRAGEVAGFSPNYAAEIVKAGVAREATPGDVKAYEVDLRGSGLEDAPKPVLVRFLRATAAGHPPAGYCGGELAGFTEDVAKQLVAAGAAELVKDVPAKPKKAKEAAEPLIKVSFLKTYPPYRKGEVAGFTRAKAAELVKKGWAKAVGEADPVETESTDPPGETVHPDAEVVGLDDRDPEWREKQGQPKGPKTEKAPAGPPADKMVRGGETKKAGKR